MPEAWFAGVAAALGLDPGGFESLGGAMNRHWRVRSGSAPLVLREYRDGRSEAGIAWEHALLRHYAARGWPVAVPSRTLPAGEGHRPLALFPLLAGEPAPEPGLAALGVLGRLLARLHADGAGFPEGANPDAGRAWELDQLAALAGGRTFHELLAAFTRDFPEPGRALRAARYRNLRELARLGYGDLPAGVLHGDFGSEHVLYDEGALTGVLDFDLACRDAFAYDIANTITADCMLRPESNVPDPARVEALIRGYTGGRRLTEAEIAAMPALLRARWLWLATWRMVQWATGVHPEWSAASVVRTVEHRLPGLDRVTPAVLAAVQRGNSA